MSECKCGHDQHQHDSEAVPALCMVCGSSEKCETPMVVNRHHVPGCKCDTANDDPALNVADPVCDEWTRIQERFFADWLAARDARIREDALKPVRALVVKWDAETRAAERRCAYCGRSIVHVEPYRLYAHMDMLSEYVHFDGESFCDGSPDSRRAHPASFQPKDALAELTIAVIDAPAQADDDGEGAS